MKKTQISEQTYPVLKQIREGGPIKINFIGTGPGSFQAKEKFKEFSSIKDLFYFPESTLRLIDDYKEMFVDKLLIPFGHELPEQEGILMMRDTTVLFRTANKKLTFYVIFGDFAAGFVELRLAAGDYRADPVALLNFTAAEEEMMNTIVRYTHLTLVFMNFFEVVKTQMSKKRQPTFKTVSGDKLRTDSDLPVNVIDARWYTEIRHNDAYYVRTHLRFQRVGPGLKTIRPVWVKGHIRGGIEREAKRKNKKD